VSFFETQCIEHLEKTIILAIGNFGQLYHNIKSLQMVGIKLTFSQLFQSLIENLMNR